MDIFTKIIPDEKDTGKKRYDEVVRRLGQGNKVEDLMFGITEDAQLMLHYNRLKTPRASNSN